MDSQIILKADPLFKQQQVKEAEVPYVEDQQLEEETTPTEAID